ncbi:hypothetical protein [Flavobacterium macrobrachii]|uniref:hypothetical protein n=1 Tax=Flavobacterium macrobrachii TaxID=591204 RepID=UPI003F6ED171
MSTLAYLINDKIPFSGSFEKFLEDKINVLRLYFDFAQYKLGVKMLGLLESKKPNITAGFLGHN